MKKKKLILPLAGLLCVILLGVFLMRGKTLATGRCIVADNGSYMLVIDNSPIVMRAIGADNMFSNLQTGDRILVIHDGILTSYPGQAGAYLCLRLQKGDMSDVPEDVLTALQELGWISSGSDEKAVPEKGIVPKGAKTITAAYEYQYANMRLELPEDWAYEIAGVNNTAEEDPVQQFGINFWPSAQPEALFRLYCVAQPIGLCGTGVTFEDVTLDNGLALTKCTEQIGDDMWVMLIFKDVAGNYALESSLPKELWDQYEPTLMAMLESLRLGEGCLKESEAIEQAKNVCTVSYDTVRASFDYQEGSWKVHFYTANAAGGDQTVRINAAGETEDTVYGE